MTTERKKLSSSFWVGALIFAIGSFLLLDRLDLLYMPWWLFSWKTLLIAIGLIIGINKRFEGIGWLILILVGAFFMIDDIPGFPYDIDRYAFPVGIIIVGLYILGRAVLGSASREAGKKSWGDGVSIDEGGEDYFDDTTIFGGNKRKVFSKNFKGGEATCIFGGSDIDLSQADINGTVVIDVVQLFGGVKLVIPSNWELKSEITAVLGGVDDKRSTPPANYGSGKKLVLTGFVMFGGVDIKSYN
jgi:predicted membrane protein